MDEKRRGEIAYQLTLVNIRRNFSLRDIADAKRNIGALAEEPEMIKADITRDEILEFGKLAVREAFEDQMAGL